LRARSAYHYSIESTIYFDQEFAGRGLERTLYSAHLDARRKDDLHRLIGGIALPNEASVGLHKTLGFRKVTHFTEVGKKFERWVDVGYWELNLA
jgi:L-amino acid N-acyltransferase YncA